MSNAMDRPWGPLKLGLEVAPPSFGTDRASEYGLRCSGKKPTSRNFLPIFRQILQ